MICGYCVIWVKTKPVNKLQKPVNKWGFPDFKFREPSPGYDPDEQHGYTDQAGED